ncbi:MAG: hypothetical protein GXO79_12370 [Chlorobi bacterium]|nr:hypothetical protein [Chlorobiota bacterium]
MKDKLEKFIAENRDEFDVYEPNQKIWENIKKNSSNRKKLIINYRMILVRIAAILIIFFSSYYFHDFMQNREKKRVSMKSKIENKFLVIPELAETEAFYSSQVSAKLEELKIYTSNDPEIAHDVQYDLSELDSVYSDIKGDLKDNIANGEVIEALIQNYRLKLKILEDLLEQLKQSKNPNIKQNEQNKIHQL